MGETDYRPLLKQALVELRDLRERLDRQTRERYGEPVAIVGMACRFPGGADSPAAFWKLLAEGRDAITEIPRERWDADAWYDRDPTVPNKMISRWGGFIEGVDRFDRAFFGVSAREAASLDPQHRLLLETAWEALEDAGQSADALRGSSAGCFLGAYATDYSEILSATGAPADAYMATGNGLSFAAGRLAYTFDWRGPALTVDTACSSSLVAVDLACQSLRRGQCSLALAGGVNVILTPTLNVILSKLFALSPSGRCRAFDAAADGFVRGEGCGIVVLKRLSDAQAAGDDILAVIRSSTVNQDGNGTGLTAPNVLAQQELLRAGLEQAGLPASAIGLIEAHGTGTPLGDPIEFDALREVLGTSRVEARPCALTSVKANIGHLEAAAGIAGLIKAVLCLRNRQIPPHLHFKTLNPNISLEGTPFVIPTALGAWEAPGSTRVAGVSSFGMSGTNAHVLVEEAPVRAADATSFADVRAHVVPVSARSPQALAALARKYADWLRSAESRDIAIADIAHSAALRRSMHRHRFAVVGSTHDELAGKLEAFARGERRPGTRVGESGRASRQRVAFVYSGQSAQWIGMGRSLLEQRGEFSSALDAIDLAVRERAGWSVIEELDRAEGQSRLGETEIIQPVLFALQVALTALWRSWGIAPDVVVGHSVGEIAAAHVAGALSLEDAVHVAVQRGALMQRSSGHGRMVAVELGWEEAERAASAFGEALCVAAHNGPRDTVLSGAPAAVAEITAALERRGVVCRALRGEYAFHSPQMEPYKPELTRALGSIAPRACTLPILSTVTGRPGAPSDFGPAYWARNIREPVLFARAIDALLAEDTNVFVEIGPHPVLTQPLSECAKTAEKAVVIAHSLRRNQPERLELLSELGALWAEGFPVDWRKQHAGARAHVRLPTYAWQDERCWIEAPSDASERPTANGAATAKVARSSAGSGHPLLGRSFSSLLDPASRAWNASIGAASLPYFADHAVEGTAVFPAAGYLEMATAAALELFGAGAHDVEEIQFRELLVLPAEGERAVQLAVSPLSDDRMRFQIASPPSPALGRAAPWVVHAEGFLHQARASSARAETEVFDAVRARCTETIDVDAFYRAMHAAGLEYGPRFRTVRTLRRSDGEAIAELREPSPSIEEDRRYALHPAILDGCFQVLAAAAARSESGATHLPVSLERLRVFATPSGPLIAHATVTRSTSVEAAAQGHVALYDAEGRLCAEACGLRWQRIGRARDEAADWLYTLAWEPRAQGTPAVPMKSSDWLIVSDRGGVARSCANYLEQLGDRVVDVDDVASAVEALRAALAEGRVCRGIVLLNTLDAPESDTTEALLVAERAAYESVLELLRAIASLTLRDPPRLMVVTRNTQSAGGRGVSVAGAGLWGLMRTLAHEHPELRPTCVDLDSSLDEAELLGLASEIHGDSEEDQIALRGAERFVARLVRRVAGEPGSVPAEGRSFGLAIEQPGALDRLRLYERSRRAPGEGEVEIEVEAAGLNFLDVLLALGMLPDGAGAPSGAIRRLGAECSGRIVAVGSGVSGLSVGDEVIALGASCFGSHVTVSSALTVRKPSSLSMTEAAGLSVTFVTAFIALVQVGRLARGERVLIHAAAGGVGMAAVQIARHLGAEIFATAGSEEKRALLRSMGIRHVMDSRSLDFADAIRAATGGEGVDVVLNSLAGEFIPKSLELLRDYGRFLEIGKRDYVANQKLGLRPFLRNLSFSLVDVGAMMQNQPERVRSALLTILELFDQGALASPPLRLFGACEAREAFRHMAQAKHVGKIVVFMKDTATRIVPAEPTAATIHGDGTYLVTGGLGGLGLEVAKWLAARGARQLVLVGRNPPSDSASGVLRMLEAQGVEVVVEAADVSAGPDVARVLAQIARSPHGLRGIVHAAGVLDDGVALQQTGSRVATVLAPKLGGAWNLHWQTRNQPLDFFVLFSSAASVLGSPGQANYAAANASLDAIAEHRRAAGLPALAIDWGPWTRVGMAAAQADRGDRMAARGLSGISPEQGVAVLERLLAAREPQVLVVPIGARQWRDLSVRASGSPLLTRLVEECSAKTDQTAAKKELLAIESAAARRLFLESKLRLEVANVLRVEAAAVDPQQPLRELGIDSLMAIELRNALEAMFGVRLPSTVVWNCPTVAALGQELLRKMDLPLVDPTASQAEPHADGVEALQDDDLLASLLAVAGDLSPEALRSVVEENETLA